MGSLTAVALATAGCSGDRDTDPGSDPGSDPGRPTSTAAVPTTPTPTPDPEPPRRFEAARALATVRDLAGGIGPRLATGPALDEAAAYVARRLRREGYAVRRESFPVPAGDSWGVPVDAGRSQNVVAEPPDFQPRKGYVLLGAHLDSIAVAPGAEDNASGVAVLLELARVLQGESQVVLVAFGGEEPVGEVEMHHYGSKHRVAAMSPAERRGLTAMVSLDRVGVGDRVPVSSVPGTPARTAEGLAAAGRRAGVPVTLGLNTTSDHESFADAGLPAARIGSTDYAAYHSADDLPRVVDPAQLSRIGRLLTAWLRAS
ncbi:hypothetical protein GCM10027062_13440 [Nocardioides hungaricus]